MQRPYRLAMRVADIVFPGARSFKPMELVTSLSNCPCSHWCCQVLKQIKILIRLRRRTLPRHESSNSRPERLSDNVFSFIISRQILSGLSIFDIWPARHFHVCVRKIHSFSVTRSVWCIVRWPVLEQAWTWFWSQPIEAYHCTTAAAAWFRSQIVVVGGWNTNGTFLWYFMLNSYLIN